MRYEIRAAIAMGAVVLVAVVGFIGLRGAMAPPLRALPAGESTDTFVVLHPELIRPSAAVYAGFASEDAEWRLHNAAPVTHTFAANGTVAAAPWRPSPRQVLDDAVYAAMQRQRLDDAIALLSTWVARHPGDRVELLKLARLLSQAGRVDESAQRYRQLLTLEHSRAR